MARPPRIDFPDALYHVTSRGTAGSKSSGRTTIVSGSSANSPTACIRPRSCCMPSPSWTTTTTSSCGHRVPTSRSFSQRLNTAYALFALQAPPPWTSVPGPVQSKARGRRNLPADVDPLHPPEPHQDRNLPEACGAARVRRLEAYAWSSYRVTSMPANAWTSSATICCTITAGHCRRPDGKTARRACLRLAERLRRSWKRWQPVGMRSAEGSSWRKPSGDWRRGGAGTSGPRSGSASLDGSHRANRRDRRGPLRRRPGGPGQLAVPAAARPSSWRWNLPAG